MLARLSGGGGEGGAGERARGKGGEGDQCSRPGTTVVVLVAGCGCGGGAPPLTTLPPEDGSMFVGWHAERRAMPAGPLRSLMRGGANEATDGTGETSQQRNEYGAMHNLWRVCGCLAA